MSVQKRKRDVDDVGSPGSIVRGMFVVAHTESSDVCLSIEKGEEHTRMRVVIPRPATVTDEDGTERQAIIPSILSANRSSTQQASTSLSASSTPVSKSGNTSYQSSPTFDDIDTFGMERDYAKRNFVKETETLMVQMEDSVQQRKVPPHHE